MSEPRPKPKPKAESVTFAAYLLEASSDWRVFTKSLLLLAGAVLSIWLGLMLVIVTVSWLRPPIRVISQDSGATVFYVAQRGEEERQWATFMLTPNAGDNGPWIDTEIPIQKGQNITIRASGHVCLAIHRLVEAASDPNDLPPPLPWTGPEGFIRDAPFPPYTSRPEEKERARFCIAPDLPQGRLIGIVSSDRPAPKPSGGVISIGRKAEFTADQSGTLWLTVNEVWLDDQHPEAYGKTPEEFDKNIRQKRYWNVWYDDNVGSFLVNVEAKP